jgi:hypothetical protein
MIKSATEAGSIPTFHYMDEVEVDALLAARTLLKEDDTLEGALSNTPSIIVCVRASPEAECLVDWGLMSHGAQNKPFEAPISPYICILGCEVVNASKILT